MEWPGWLYARHDGTFPEWYKVQFIFVAYVYRESIYLPISDEVSVTGMDTISC